MEGWISLYRKIQEHWIWKSNEPFDKRSAWLSLLFKANHKDTKIMMDNKVINIKKGSFITSEIKLANEWKWSRKKVRTFLKGLEMDKMLTKNSTTKYTTISIENWGLYQKVEQQENSKGTTKGQQRNTDNNDNNIYLYLLNKYKQNPPKTYSEKIHRIAQIKNSLEYQKLSIEEQDKLFCELMTYKGG